VNEPRSGGHQVLLAVYAVFAVAAGCRSAVQLATRADEAPVAYTLSLAAALTYALGWFAIRRAVDGDYGFASVMLWVELGGVVGVGTLSILEEDWFPDATVWSDFGIGYGFVPAFLPVAGLIWLRGRRLERASGFGLVLAFRVVAVAEAVSWLGLLSGMYAKHVAEVGERGVQVFGPIHGAVFMAYVAIAILTWYQQRWSLRVGIVALACSIPPLFTLAFELWAVRAGRLSVGGQATPSSS
jgi:integral membrane protein